MSNVSFKIKQDRVGLRKEKVTVTIIAVATVRLLFGICDWTLDGDVGQGGFLTRAGDLHLCDTRAVRSHGSSGLYYHYRSYHNFYFKAAFSEI